MTGRPKFSSSIKLAIDSYQELKRHSKTRPKCLRFIDLSYLVGCMFCVIDNLAALCKSGCNQKFGSPVRTSTSAIGELYFAVAADKFL
jgi:hypothetical protein